MLGGLRAEVVAQLRRGFELAAGDAELVDQFHLAPDVRAGDLAPQELAVALHRVRDFVGRLIDEFHPELACAERQETVQKLRAGLRAVV